MNIPIEAARFKALTKLAADSFGEITPTEEDVLRDCASAPDLLGSEFDERPNVRAEFLRWLVTDKEAATYIDPSGIRLGSKTISSDLDLDSCKSAFPLDFLYCTFKGGISLQFAEIPFLRLILCNIELDINADGLQTQGGVFLRGLSGKGSLEFTAAHIRGDLDCAGSHLKPEGLASAESALSATRAHIDGDVLLCEFLGRDFFSAGEINLADTEIGGNVRLSGASLSNKDRGFTIDRVKVGGNVEFGREFFSEGTISLIDAEIRGNLDCSNTTLGNASKAMVAERAGITGSIHLTGGFASWGPIDFSGAHIGGDLDCTGATLKGGDSALIADDAIISGSVFLRNWLARSGNIGSRGFTAHGTIRMVGAQISGDLDCAGGKLAKSGCALTLDRAKIARNVNLTDHFSSSGAISLLNTQIDGSLDCSTANFATEGDALVADRSQISHDISFRNTFSPSATNRFFSAEINGDFDCTGATLGTLDCEGMRVNRDLIWRNIQPQPCRARLNLTRSSVRGLHDDKDSWPPKGNLHLDGFVYQELILDRSASPQNVARESTLLLDPQSRVDWLKQQPDSELTRPQPWLQLARILAENGNPDGAKWVIYMFHRQQSEKDEEPARSASFLYDKLEEQPLWILVPITSLWVLGSLVFWRARRVKAMAPTEASAFDEFQKCGKAPDKYVPFSPAIYTLENVLPVVTLGQDDKWGPNPQKGPVSRFPNRSRLGWTRWFPGLNYPWLALLRWTLILLGWALALILGAAIGGLFKP